MPLKPPMLASRLGVGAVRVIVTSLSPVASTDSTSAKRNEFASSSSMIRS